MKKILFLTLLLFSLKVSACTTLGGLFAQFAIAAYFSVIATQVEKITKPERIYQATNILSNKYGCQILGEDLFNEGVNMYVGLESEMNQWRKTNPDLVNACKEFDVNFRNAYHGNTIK